MISACADIASGTNNNDTAYFMISSCDQRPVTGMKPKLQLRSWLMVTLVQLPVPLHEPVQTMS
jgi:hypothetical protein